MTDSLHIPVLLKESIDSLAIVAEDSVVDGTFGGGGHSSLLLERYGTTITLTCVDLDEAAQERYQKRIVERFPECHTHFVHDNFKSVASILAQSGEKNVSKVLLDLGTSTFQLLADTRGFSFMSDAPLSMTFSHAGAHTGFTAATIVNEWQEDSIADIIYGYGEDRMARKIARAIVLARVSAPIKTSKELADIIAGAIPRRGRIHPATKTFQALRIAVNDELAVISEALEQWWQQLPVGGRISVITFHSLEDRIVKRWIQQQTDGVAITKKPIAPSLEELTHNPRSRSAKLRCIEKKV